MNFFRLLPLSILLFLPVESFADGVFTLIPESGPLAEKFVSGDFDWIDIVYYALYLIRFLVSVAGIVAVILLMISGFQYIFGASMDDDEQGKKSIQNTLIGFAIIILSWTIVDLVISVVSSRYLT
mgnify:CR=1 FL=1